MKIDTVEELESVLGDPSKFSDHIADVIGEHMKGLPDMVGTAVGSAVGGAIEKGIIKRPLMDQMKEEPEFVWTPEAVKRVRAGYQRSNFRGDFKHAGDYLMAVKADNRGVTDPRLKAPLAEGSGEVGGFTVPEEYDMQLRMISLEDAIIRPRTTRVPMGSNQVHLPVIRDTSHASNLFGGVTANWAAEAGTLTESEPTFAQVTLTAKKLTGYTVASNELLADSAIGLEALINNLFPQAITWYEENSFINGAGGGQPLGFLAAPATISVTRTSANLIVYEDVVNIYSRMLPRSRANGIWLASPDTLPQLLTMALSVGTGGSAVWVVPGGAQDAPPVNIFGRPVYFTEHAAALGTKGDISFCDFSYYLVGDRGSLTMAASPHVKFTSDQTVWRFIERLDGRPWIDSALTPQNGGNSLSPFVTLAT